MTLYKCKYTLKVVMYFIYILNLHSFFPKRFIGPVGIATGFEQQLP